MTWKELPNGSWVSRDGYYVVNKVHNAFHAWFQMRGVGKHLGESTRASDCKWMCRNYSVKGGRAMVSAVGSAR